MELHTALINGQDSYLKIVTIDAIYPSDSSLGKTFDITSGLKAFNLLKWNTFLPRTMTTGTMIIGTMTITEKAWKMITVDSPDDYEKITFVMTLVYAQVGQLTLTTVSLSPVTVTEVKESISQDDVDLMFVTRGVKTGSIILRR